MCLGPSRYRMAPQPRLFLSHLASKLGIPRMTWRWWKPSPLALAMAVGSSRQMCERHVSIEMRFRTQRGKHHSIAGHDDQDCVVGVHPADIQPAHDMSILHPKGTVRSPSSRARGRNRIRVPTVPETVDVGRNISSGECLDGVCQLLKLQGLVAPPSVNMPSSA